MRHVHAFGDDALGHLDAVGVIEAIKSGRVGRAEVVEAAIARTEAVNPALNGLAYEAFDRARAQAAGTGPTTGFFSGVPTFVKDNVDVAGLPTMQGTDAWPPRPAEADGDFARMYLATGMTPLGKTQMSEYGFSASAEHPRLGSVRNPWNTDHTAGASSSGSGAFVAAGVVPIAHANDGGGSIRIPASCNGLVGLKPSRGRLPLDKEVSRMPIRIVANGVLSRSVRDTAAFYREAERIWPAPKLPPIGDVQHAGRAAAADRRHHPLAAAGVQPRAARADTEIRRAARRARPPRRPSRKAAGACQFRVRLRALLGAAGDGPDSAEPARLRRVRRHPVGQPVTGPGPARAPQSASHSAGADALGSRAAAHRAPGSHLRRGVDADVGRRAAADRLPRPDCRLSSKIIDRLQDWVAFTPLQNVTGEPAISLPLAISANGLPVGMMFSAPMGQEAPACWNWLTNSKTPEPWARIDQT